MAKNKYIFAVSGAHNEIGEFRILEGEIPNLSLRKFDFQPGEIGTYDTEKNPKGLFIVEIDTESETNNSIRKYIKSLYEMISFPPMVEYGIISKEAMYEILENNINIVPLIIGKYEPIKMKGVSNE